MNDLTINDVRTLLRQVPYPGTTRNIVSAGFVRELNLDGAAVTVSFMPNCTDQQKVADMEGRIRDVLYGAGFALVSIDTESPYDDDSMFLGGGSMSPLQAEMLEDGVEPQPDVLLGDLGRHAAGQVAAVSQAEDDGPTWGAEPDYSGPLPVLQWQIDPQDGAAESVQRAVRLAGWEFRVWWQRHAEGNLYYSCLQALREDWIDHGGVARKHPVGRTEAVNLVYDAQRSAVVAVYGTARDFRPFVEAFRMAFVAEYGSDTAAPSARPAGELAAATRGTP